MEERIIEEIGQDSQSEMEKTQKEAVLEADNKEKNKRPAWKEILSWCMTLLAAFVLAIVLKNYVIINATVPTGSMENTIEPGDDLFGFRLAYKFAEPERGDIVIFRFPDDESQKYVKRVIGLPGETILVKKGNVYASGKKLRSSFVRSMNDTSGDGVYKVPKGHYFMMGDNRDNSNDSRFWIHKYVPLSNFTCKAQCIIYPFARAKFLKRK